MGFAVSVWAYSIHAVKQDNFDDVDFEALNTSVEEKAKRISLEDEAKARIQTPPSAVPIPETSPAASTPSNTANPSSGGGWFSWGSK